VHEDAGSAKLAKEEANKSLQEKPNVPAYLVLARLALEQHSSEDAAENAHKALELDPNNTAAKGLLQAVSKLPPASAQKAPAAPGQKTQ
jgi:Tfp pilus assembly protein PilF